MKPNWKPLPASQLSPRVGRRAEVKPYSVWGMEGGWDAKGLLENVFKTIKLWTFARGNLWRALGVASALA